MIWFNKDKINILNYILIKKWKNPISKVYKIHIKDVWCNARCSFCDDRKIKSDIKFTKEWINNLILKILKEKIKYKLIYLFWWEPLIIYNYLLKIIKLCSKYWIIFDFPTNASLLSIERIDELITSWLTKFTFSIDFPNEKHDLLRKLPWVYKKILLFTNYIKKKWCIVQWNTVVWKFNYTDILDFHKIYENSKPNIHSYINLELNWNESKNFLLNENECKIVKEKLLILRKKNNWIEINIEWFNKYINSKSQKVWKCFVPLIWIHYFIKRWKKIDFSPCYLSPEKIKNLQYFSNNAINKWCNKCKSSHKDNYNNYMSDLIKKYKLSNK